MLGSIIGAMAQQTIQALPRKSYLRERWDALHRQAEALGGTSESAPDRALAYFQLYQESGGNFMFPLVATHGSLWGVSHTLRLQRWLGRLTPLSRRGRVQRWLDSLEAVRDINRRVFIEIWTTWHFTAQFGTELEARELVHPEVLALYNELHRARREGRLLPVHDRERIYYQVFLHEQDQIVDPGIQEAVRTSGSRMVEVFRRVSPRFRYFPAGRRLWFTDFTDVAQRNREGLRALRFAEQVGAERVRQAMCDYPGLDVPPAG